MQLQAVSIIGMNVQERGGICAAVAQRFALVDPFLTEQSRRMWAAAEAVAIGHHGNAIVAEATGLSRTTITKARAQLAQADDSGSGRQRRPGAGRKPLAEVDA